MGLNRVIHNTNKPLTFNPSLKDWANSQLRFGISLLRQDSYEDFPDSSRTFKDALFNVRLIHCRLVDAGAGYQAQRVAVWIKKARVNKGFLS